MGMAAVLVGMMALNAGPAMAAEIDGGTTTLDELCSPGLSDGFFIPGCIFSDSIEADDGDGEEVFFFFVDDNDFDFNDDDFDHGDFDFDDDNDDDDNNNNDDNERESVSIIR
jgi:hypothetical protein